jgi:hypothetical protein
LGFCAKTGKQLRGGFIAPCLKVLEREIKQLLVLDVGIQRLKWARVFHDPLQGLEFVACFLGDVIIAG